jgi:hypothetical protein
MIFFYIGDDLITLDEASHEGKHNKAMNKEMSVINKK